MTCRHQRQGKLERGYCMMIGGETDIGIASGSHLLQRFAPGTGDIPRTPGREKLDGTAELGYLHCGNNGGKQS